MRPKKTPPPKPKNGEPQTHNLQTTHSPHRKTVRRRAQARKPYQERLLNMAEARREIVMALKLHRASMKQAREKNNPGPEHQRFGLGPVTHQSSAEQEAILKSRRNPRTYASTYVNNINAYSPGLYLPPYYSRPVSSSAPPLFIQENNPNFVLPKQTLGLKLNLQNFNNLDTAFYSSANSSSIYNSSSSTPSISCSTGVAYVAGSPAADIRSVGDDRRWGDDLNLGVSGGRAEFLGPDQEELDVRSPFDEVMELPAAWLNGDESCVGDVCGGADYFPDPALPCMDIEEIEGMDEDWLA